MTNISLTPCPILANKADKKMILRFYKDNHYSARFIGYDSCYLIKENGEIIASVIISQGNKSQQIDITGEITAADTSQYLSQKKPQYLLHALLVTPDYQKQGYAQHLLKYATTYHQSLVCFAQASLKDLYLNNGFTLITEELLSQYLNPDLFNRFQQYSKNKFDLKAFIHDQI